MLLWVLCRLCLCVFTVFEARTDFLPSYSLRYLAELYANLCAGKVDRPMMKNLILDTKEFVFGEKNFKKNFLFDRR